MVDLRHHAVRYRLGVLNAESLTSIADQLLKEGYDTPTVIQLSILDSPVTEDAAPLFEKMCAERGVQIPTNEEAVSELLHYYLESVASGTRTPQEGLRSMMVEVFGPYISNEKTKEYVGDSHGLEHLIGAFYSYDDLLERPETSFHGKHGKEAIALYDTYVRELALDWLQKHPRKV